MTEQPFFMGLTQSQIREAITFYRAYAHVHNTDHFKLTMLRAELEGRKESFNKMYGDIGKLKEDIHTLEKRISYNSGEATK